MKESLGSRLDEAMIVSRFKGTWNGGIVELVVELYGNSGMVDGASLLNALEAKRIVLGGYLLTLEGFSTYLKVSRLITKLRT